MCTRTFVRLNDHYRCSLVTREGVSTKYNCNTYICTGAALWREAVIELIYFDEIGLRHNIFGLLTLIQLIFFSFLHILDISILN